MGIIPNPLAQVTDYQSMLRRIAASNYFITLACLWLIRSYCASIDSALPKYQFEVEIGPVKKLSMDAAYVILPLLFVVPAYAFRLHNRVSTILGIRYRYDTENIIRPMAITVGISESDLPRLYENRDRLMPAIFTKYTDSTNPIISKHLVLEALDHLSWLWTLLEASIISAFTGLVICLFGPWPVGLMIFLATAVCLMNVFPILRNQCKDRTRQEVEAILSDRTRRDDIRRELNAV